MARFHVKVEDCVWMWLEVEVEAGSIEDAMEQAQQIARATNYEEWDPVHSALDKDRLINMHDLDNDIEVSLFDGDHIEDNIQSLMFSREGNSLCDDPKLVQEVYSNQLFQKFDKKTAAASNRRRKGRRL